MPLNRKFLEKILNTQYLTDNFLKLGRSRLLGTVDKIVANPPFTKNQDIDHIRLMYDLLKPGGRIRTIASTSWQRPSDNKQKEFVKWLNELDSDVNDIPAGAFKESGTNIPTCLITINKQ